MQSRRCRREHGRTGCEGPGRKGRDLPGQGDRDRQRRHAEPTTPPMIEARELTRDKRKSLRARFRRDPVYHVEKVQGVRTLEGYQKMILDTVALYERVVIAACHDVGKTFTLSKAVLWFTSTFRGAKVISTAPTYNQVKRLLWSEIR